MLVQMLASGFFGQWVHLHGRNALPRLGFELADLNHCPLHIPPPLAPRPPLPPNPRPPLPLRVLCFHVCE